MRDGLLDELTCQRIATFEQWAPLLSARQRFVVAGIIETLEKFGSINGRQEEYINLAFVGVEGIKR